MTDADVERLGPAILHAMEAATPAHEAVARHLFERLSPDRWTIEWHLPRWLGTAFGLADDVVDELVVSNVVGLGSIRLQDDLADCEVPFDGIADAADVATALFDRALKPYRAWFPPTSPFWASFNALMATWRSSDQERLASRAAPLKISALAVCLLTGRSEATAAIDGCLDEAITGLVLADDLADWRSDLDAGRWNAFVASVADQPQEPQFRAENRRTVLLKAMSESAVGCYVGRVVAHMGGAAARADELGVLPLADFCRRFADEIDAQGAALAMHYQHVAETMSATLQAARVVNR